MVLQLRSCLISKFFKFFFLVLLLEVSYMESGNHSNKFSTDRFSSGHITNCFSSISLDINLYIVNREKQPIFSNHTNYTIIMDLFMYRFPSNDKLQHILMYSLKTVDSNNSSRTSNLYLC